MLARHPEAGRLHDELGAGIRLYPVGQYVIAYQIDHDVITIVRILSGFRDIAAQLA